MRLLASGPFEPAGTAAAVLLTPRTPAELQLAAIRALAPRDRAEVAGLLLASWTAYSPSVRREATEALFARTERLARLLDALEKKTVLANQLDPGAAGEASQALRPGPAKASPRRSWRAR